MGEGCEVRGRQSGLRRGKVPSFHKSRSANQIGVAAAGRSCFLALASVYSSTRHWPNVRFSNRPSGIKHFQAIQHSSVDVAHGLALLFGLGTRALPSWDSKTRWNNLLGDLAVNITAGSSGHTNSAHPSSREGHHSTVGWIAGFLLFDLILHSHAGATSLVHRKSVPSTQMRCMITANRRASATIAFFIPRCLAIFIARP